MSYGWEKKEREKTWGTRKNTRNYTKNVYSFKQQVHASFSLKHNWSVPVAQPSLPIRVAKK